MSGRASAVASGYTPWYSALAWRWGHTKSVTKRSRASTTYAREAPADIARSSTPFRSEPPPRSTVRVMTSTSYCSLSHATATDVSSPPE